MTKLVFDTPGLMDTRSITLQGVSAKPNTTSPIGYFGTGLKYSIASLVRMGSNPVIFIGNDRFTFFKRPDEFRGVEFEKISMRRDRFGLLGRGRITDLPFTTMYGRTWKPWIIVRELESNTRDEEGESYLSKDEVQPREGRTLIVVEEPEVIEAYNTLADIFLPEGERKGTGVQVINKPSKFLYWRGMRVYQLDKEAAHTYNILDFVTLTEDRTLPYEYDARNKISRWVQTEADAAQVQEVVTGKDNWESSLSYERSIPPSPAFRDTMVLRRNAALPQVRSYYESHDEDITEKTFKLFEAHPWPWTCEEDAVIDAKGRKIFDMPYDYQGKWQVVGEKIIAMYEKYREETDD